MVHHHFWEIPSTIDLEGFLKQHPPDFKYKIDHFYYIIDYLSRKMDFDDLDGNAGFININAQKLQGVIRNYNKYLNHLRKDGFICTDWNYVKGEKSRGYCLGGTWDYNVTVKKVPVKDFVMMKKVVAEKEESENLKTKTQKDHPYLSRWFNDFLEIDVNGALAKVKELFPEPTGGIKGIPKRKASDWSKVYKSVNSINKIANKEFYYGVDYNVGRFHSNLTNLKKEVRNFITYNGQKLVNVDIKNSQPLLSTLLFDKEFFNKNSPKLNLYNITNIQSLISNNRHSFNSHNIMIVKSLEKSNKQDINEYIDFVNSGDFYHRISQKLYPEEPFDKQRVKTMVFMIFFSKNQYMGQEKAAAKRKFKSMFPRTYEIFRLLKLCDHTALARILQRIESTIMIEKVVPRISRERPQLPIFTIHDSIATTEGNEFYIESVIVEEIKKHTGLDAKIGKEFWR